MTDRKIFQEVYLRFYPSLLVYGKSITSDEQAIEDTIQELFLSFWQKKEQLVLKASLENYLFISFRNNLFRKLKRNPTVQLHEGILQLPDSKVSYEQEEKLNKLLELLPAHQKEVLFLRYYKNKSYQEISEILGINYQVARNFSFRAVKFLKKKMLKIKTRTA